MIGADGDGLANAKQYHRRGEKTLGVCLVFKLLKKKEEMSFELKLEAWGLIETFIPVIEVAGIIYNNVRLHAVLAI